MIKGIHHVSLKTENDEQYKKVCEFYADILGLSVLKECDACTLFNTPSGIVEIFRDGNNSLPQGVIRHFAFSVDSVDTYAETVKKHGYEVFIEPKDVLIGGDENFPARVAFCKGPLDEDIEFFEQKWK